MFKNSGYKYMKASPKAKTYKASSNLKTSSLPSKVDLRPFLAPVENQGQVGSCTANAVVSACEYLLKKTHQGKYFDVSRLFVYYNARWRGGTQNKDSGSHIQYAVESLQKFGACSEKTWPYDTSKVLQQPNQQSYEEAKEFRISDYLKVPTELEEWKKCLASGFPIIFGCALFGSFDKATQRGGIVEMPSPQDASRKEHGLHAMLCVGYSDPDQSFIVKNSWGEDWGDKGYCYMPYNYLMSQKFNLNDSWIVRSADSVPNNEETWQTGNTTIINDGNGYDWFDPEENNQYHEEDYEEFDPFQDIEDFIEEYTDEVPEDLYGFFDDLFEDEEIHFDDERFDEGELGSFGDEEDDEDEIDSMVDELEEEREEYDEDEEEEEYDDSEEEEEEGEEEYDDSDEEEGEEEEEYDDSEEEGEEEEYDDSEEEGEEEEYDDSEEEESEEEEE